MISIAFIVNILATLLMVGIIWTLQMVHYPSLKFMQGQYPQYAPFQRMKLTLITYPLMTLELLTSIAVVLFAANIPRDQPQKETSFILMGVALIVLGVNWVVTFQQMRPLLKKLSENFDENTCKQLENWNWVRTAGWTLRAILLLSTIFKTA